MNTPGKMNCCKYDYPDDFFPQRKCDKSNNVTIMATTKLGLEACS